MHLHLATALARSWWALSLSNRMAWCPECAAIRHSAL